MFFYYRKRTMRTVNCVYSKLLFFPRDHYSIATRFSLSVVDYTSDCFTPLCSGPSNGAADSRDGCLHCGKYEIKRKSLIN